MLELQARGCNNNNFVTTPEHVVPQILEALPYAIERGLRPPGAPASAAVDGANSTPGATDIVSAASQT